MKKPKITCKYRLNGKYHNKTITVDKLPCNEKGWVLEDEITKLLQSLLPIGAIILWHQARCEAWGNL